MALGETNCYRWTYARVGNRNATVTATQTIPRAATVLKANKRVAENVFVGRLSILQMLHLQDGDSLRGRVTAGSHCTQTRHVT